MITPPCPPGGRTRTRTHLAADEPRIPPFFHLCCCWLDGRICGLDALACDRPRDHDLAIHRCERVGACNRVVWRQPFAQRCGSRHFAGFHAAGEVQGKVHLGLERIRNSVIVRLRLQDLLGSKQQLPSLGGHSETRKRADGNEHTRCLQRPAVLVRIVCQGHMSRAWPSTVAPSPRAQHSARLEDAPPSMLVERSSLALVW